MAVLKLDNQVVAQTPWKQNSQQCWDQRMTFDLDRVSILKKLYDCLFDLFQCLHSEQHYCMIITF